MTHNRLRVGKGDPAQQKGIKPTTQPRIQKWIINARLEGHTYARYSRFPTRCAFTYIYTHVLRGSVLSTLNPTFPQPCVTVHSVVPLDLHSSSFRCSPRLIFLFIVVFPQPYIPVHSTVPSALCSTSFRCSLSPTFQFIPVYPQPYVPVHSGVPSALCSSSFRCSLSPMLQFIPVFPQPYVPVHSGVPSAMFQFIPVFPHPYVLSAT